MSEFIDVNKWIPIHTLPGFECCIEYYISREGEVKSTKGRKERILKGVVIPNGYKKVTLQQRLGQKEELQPYVHTLVALAFIGSPPTPMGRFKHCSVVDHKDENKLNNHVDNLHWVSVKDNICKKPYAKFQKIYKSEGERLKQEQQDRDNAKKRQRKFRARKRMEPAECLKREEKQKHREKRKEEIKEYKRNIREAIKNDPEKLAKQREYQREYMRRKRAAEKQVKIEEHND